MTISILLATYNGEKYILEQLNSLINQTRSFDELVIVDDGSCDQTLKIIENFIEDNRLENKSKVIINEKNKGWKSNFIEGIDQTTGDIIFFCDQDDIWFLNKIEVFCEKFEENPDINVVASHETLWNGTDYQDYHTKPDRYRIPELDDKGNDFIIQCPGCAMAIRRAYVNFILPHYKTGWAHDDFIWKMSAIDKCMLFLDDTSILHRIHDTNASRIKRNLNSSINDVINDIRVIEILCNYIEETRDNTAMISLLSYLNKRKSLCELRREFLENHKVSTFLKLGMTGLQIYAKKRYWIGDFLLVHGYRDEKCV